MARRHVRGGRAASFWNDFFAIFGIERRQVAAFERLATRATTGNRGWIDLLFPGQMGVEHKSAGEDLDAAVEQLLDYLPDLTAAEHPWLLIACDFKRFKWQNLDADEARLSRKSWNLRWRSPA